MKNKRTYIVYIVEILTGLAIEGLALLGLFRETGALTGIGSGILAVGLVQLFRAFRIERDPELKKRFETAAKDERYAFISMKAKEAAFAIYLIIAGVLCMAFLVLGYEREGMLAAMSICALVILYTVMFRILAKKY